MLLFISATDLESYPNFMPSESSLPLKDESLSIIKAKGDPKYSSNSKLVSKLLNTEIISSFDK